MKRSIIDFKRHPWLHFVSVSTITIALLILGTFFLCYRNLEVLADKTKSQNTGTIYLKEGLTEEQISQTSDKILGFPGVRGVQFKSRQSVIEELQSFLGQTDASSLPGTELFPDILEVETKQNATSGELADLKTMMGAMPEITEIDFSEDWLAQFKKLRRMFNIFGAFLMVAIIIGCGFIIANFMGMRHQSRRDEIDIVRLHGAHRGFILAPFLWEGFIEGVTGAILSLLLLAAVKSLFGAFVTIQWASLIGVKDLSFLSFGQIVAVLVIGIAMAFFGSIAVFLRFQERPSR